MKQIQEPNQKEWNDFILKESNHHLPDECRDGVCVDVGCNIGDFVIRHKNRFNHYYCIDAFKKNIEEARKNTQDIKCNIEIENLAAWSESSKVIYIYAYKRRNDEDLNYFGNTGNIGCIEHVDSNSHGWSGWHKQNTIGQCETISLKNIKEKFKKIKLLKVDIEGSEYEFLLNQDLSQIDYILIELHLELEKQEKLKNWILKTHDLIKEYSTQNFLFKQKHPSNKKIIYLTGCFGFIGSYITRLALMEGWYVRGIDKCTYASRKDILFKEFSQYSNFFYEETDINNIKNLFDCDYIINTAAETHVGNSIVNSEDFIHSNIQGVHSILEAIRKYKIEGTKKPIFFHFSTDEVYGDINQGSFDENDILLPSNPYSATKAAADMLIKAWARTYNINYIILRPSNNYGIGQYVEKLIPKSIKYLCLDKKIALHNCGLPIRSWLHAEDTARAVIHLIKLNKVNEIYNISGNYQDTNLNIVKKIISNFNNDSDYEKYLDLSYSRAGQDVRYSVNDNKLKNTGWQAIKEFDKELPEIIKFYKNNYIW